MLAVGGLIAQAAPANTSAATLYTQSNLPVLEVTAICVCNTTGTAATFRLFHDQDGTTYAANNALYYDKSVPANDSIWIRAESMGAGIFLSEGDSLGIQSGTADALTFSAYGVGAQVARSQVVRT